MNTATEHGSPPLELIDTLLSGNGWKARLQAGYCNIALRRRSLSIPDGDLETQAFGAINPLRQVPVLRTREGEWLYESSAILWYLAQGTSFMPVDAMAQGQVIQWLMFEQTKLMWNLAQPRLWIALRQTMKGDDPRAQRWRARGYEALQVLDSHLAGRDFVLDSGASIADVALYPYVRMAPQGGYEMQRFVEIARWQRNMRALPGHVPLIEGDNDTA